MRKIVLGNRIPSAPIALGCMRMPGLEVAKAERVVLSAVEQGIDLFDHADIYGNGESELIFAQVLKRNPGLREKILIQDKCGIVRNVGYDASKEHILFAVEGSLKRLGIEQLDFLLLHRPDALMEPEEVAQAFTLLEKQGKVKYFGVSNQNPGQIELLQKYMPQRILINQLQLSLAHTPIIDQGINMNTHNGYGVMKDGSVLDYCRLKDISIQAWSPFMYGMFEGVFLKSEKYAPLNKLIATIAKEKEVTDSAIAVAWIMRHPAKIQTLLGTMNEQRLKDICAAATIDLTRKQWYDLYKAAGNPLP